MDDEFGAASGRLDLVRLDRLVGKVDDVDFGKDVARIPIAFLDFSFFGRRSQRVRGKDAESNEGSP